MSAPVLPSSVPRSGFGQSIRWDEETIAEHDKYRGTRMRINEPKTPFEHLRPGSADTSSAGGLFGDDLTASSCPVSGAGASSPTAAAVAATALAARAAALRGPSEESHDDFAGRGGGYSSAGGGHYSDHDSLACSEGEGGLSAEWERGTMSARSSTGGSPAPLPDGELDDEVHAEAARERAIARRAELRRRRSGSRSSTGTRESGSEAGGGPASTSGGSTTTPRRVSFADEADDDEAGVAIDDITASADPSAADVPARATAARTAHRRRTRFDAAAPGTGAPAASSASVSATALSSQSAQPTVLASGAAEFLGKRKQHYAGAPGLSMKELLRRGRAAMPVDDDDDDEDDD